MAQYLTLKEAAGMEHNAVFISRGCITKVQAKKYLKCASCWKKVPGNLLCGHCKHQNNRELFSLLLKVLLFNIIFLIQYATVSRN